MHPILSVFLAMGLALAGCASPTVTGDLSDEFAEEGLKRVTSSGFDTAYVYPDAGLARFSDVRITPMEVADVEVGSTAVSGTARSNWTMTVERERALQQLWENSTSRAFADYPRESDAQTTLRLDSALTRIIPGRSSGTATTAGGQVIAGSSDSVDVSAEFRLYDNASGQLLAVIRDRRTLPGLAWTRMAGSDLANQFSRWAGLLHTRINGR